MDVHGTFPVSCLACVDLPSIGLVSVLSVWICTVQVWFLSCLCTATEHNVVCGLTADVCLSATEHRLVFGLTAGGVCQLLNTM